MTDDRQRRECKDSFTKTAAYDNRSVLVIQIPRKCKENERWKHEFMKLRRRGSLTEILMKKNIILEDLMKHAIREEMGQEEEDFKLHIVLQRISMWKI